MLRPSCLSGFGDFPPRAQLELTVLSSSCLSNGPGSSRRGRCEQLELSTLSTSRARPWRRQSPTSKFFYEARRGGRGYRQLELSMFSSSWSHPSESRVFGYPGREIGMQLELTIFSSSCSQGPIWARFRPVFGSCFQNSSHLSATLGESGGSEPLRACSPERTTAARRPRPLRAMVERRPKSTPQPIHCLNQTLRARPTRLAPGPCTR
jgi:hypothetical protein